MKSEASRDEFIKKRMARRKKIRKRRLKVFFVLFTVLVLLVGGVLSLTVFFPIEKIGIDGSKIYSDEEILEASGIEGGDNLFTISQNKVQTVLKQKLPYIDSIVFKRVLPNTLRITVKDASEVAVFKVKDKYYTVSSSGWVLEENRKKPKNLIHIVCDAKCAVGTEIIINSTKQKELLLVISNALKDKEIEADTIDISSASSIKLNVLNRFDVNLGNANNIPEKISHLKGMLNEISDEKKGKIDLSMWTNTNKDGAFRIEND